jgi:sialate O-acetylesterase
MKIKFLAAWGFALLLSIAANAQLKLASLFTDNMVLQQQFNAPIWGWDDAGESVTVTTSWNNKSYKATASATGRWMVKVATPSYGGPYSVTINGSKTIKLNNVLIGEVWLCAGQSNMEMPVKGFRGAPVVGSLEAILKSANPNIHIYTVPRGSVTTPQDNSKPSDWHVASPEFVANFSGTGYFFGRLLNEMLHIPIGLISDNYGGSTAEAWMDAEGLKDFTEVRIPAATDSIRVVSRTPTTLFNAMIYPVIGYGIKGCIYYQGESNYERPDQYEKLFPAMVKRWRDLWGQGDFPFYYAQIAPYDYSQLPPYNSGGKYNSAYLRDAQRKALKYIPNSAMAVLMDVGEQGTIHPAHKEEPGTRLAYLALEKTYGFAVKTFNYGSPLYQDMTVSGNIATVKFLNADFGLTSFGKPLQYFEIAGKDKSFHPALATISGTMVILSSPLVKEPVAVRYAFRDFVVGDLFGNNGLPASSFRTDDW